VHNRDVETSATIMERWSDSRERSLAQDGQVCTGNPWGLDCIPIGSSGGSGAAIAAGYCDVSQIAAHPHFRARELLLYVNDPQLGLTPTTHVHPRLSATPGGIGTLGGPIGRDKAAGTTVIGTASLIYQLCRATTPGVDPWTGETPLRRYSHDTNRAPGLHRSGRA
jgi:hypothetical protein